MSHMMNDKTAASLVLIAVVGIILALAVGFGTASASKTPEGLRYAQARRIGVIQVYDDTIPHVALIRCYVVGGNNSISCVKI